MGFDLFSVFVASPPIMFLLSSLAHAQALSPFFPYALHHLHPHCSFELTLAFSVNFFVRFSSGCLSSHHRPPDVSFPAENNTTNPLTTWYFSFAPVSNTPRSIVSEEWETVETLMGVSRGMMELLNRVSLPLFLSLPSSPLLFFLTPPPRPPSPLSLVRLAR